MTITVKWPGLASKPHEYGVPPDLGFMINAKQYNLNNLGKYDYALLEDGAAPNIKISPNADVLALKMFLASTTGLPSDKQVLRLCTATEHFPTGHILQDNKDLYHYGIQDGCELFLANGCSLLLSDRFSEDSLHWTGELAASATAFRERRYMRAAQMAMATAALNAQRDPLTEMPQNPDQPHIDAALLLSAAPPCMRDTTHAACHGSRAEHQAEQQRPPTILAYEGPKEVNCIR